MKIVINPRYEYLRPFVCRLADPSFPGHTGTLLHDGRNRVEIAEAEGVKVAVKSYNRMTLFNRVVYGTVRKSKAMRAYIHAQKVRRAGIDTPEEIAVIEIRRHGMMRRCVFVSRYSDYNPLRPVTERLMTDQHAGPVLDALAEFLVKLHDAGISHNDLNIGNILYKEETAPDGRKHYRFQIIDINRMTFRRHLSMYRRIDDMRRLSCPAPAYMYILGRYARTIDIDTEYIQLKGALRRLIFEWRKRTEHKIKAVIRNKRNNALR